jgi:hypothetical protein
LLNANLSIIKKYYIGCNLKMVFKTAFAVALFSMQCGLASATVADCNQAPLEEMKKELQAALAEHLIVEDTDSPLERHKIGAADLKEMPAQGVVPNQQMAISIGKILLAGMYGQKLVDSMKPFTAKLMKNNTWLVHRKMYTGKTADRCVAYFRDIYVAVKKTDGRVVGFYYEK